jgi:hypothetical protein
MLYNLGIDMDIETGPPDFPFPSHLSAYLLYSSIFNVPIFKVSRHPQEG